MIEKRTINHNSIKLLIILNQFKNKKTEFYDFRRLFFFYLTSEYPDILKRILKDMFNKEIYVKKYQSENIEYEIFHEKKFYDLTYLKSLLLNLQSRNLIKIETVEKNKLIKLTSEAEKLIEKVDEILYFDYLNRAEYIKKYLGPLSNEKINYLLLNYMPKTIYVE